MKVAPFKPEWLKIRPPGGDNYRNIKTLLQKLKLHTVCEEAHCPNIGECWGGGTATIMLMGDVCTRGCRFCHVKTGNPRQQIDAAEPHRVAEAIVQLGLTYVVLTSVNRDDLPDGGADHFAQTVEAIKKADENILVEVLVPDFQGDKHAIRRLVDGGADVLAHNLETVRRLTPMVRDKKASYDQSIGVLAEMKALVPFRFTKSSLMVGLGENADEIYESMEDLRVVEVDILTVGQYLRPSPWHLPVREFVRPDTFRVYEFVGLKKGFRFVASGPLVRSSYRAGEKFVENILRNQAHASH